jgi:plastocyanin
LARGISSAAAVGAVVSILIVAAVAGLAYFQFNVAPSVFTSTTTSTTPSVTCPSSACVNVTIPSGASSPPSGYTPGQKTQFGFSPETITVVIGKNNTVYFINNDAGVHTATSDTAGAFDSGNIQPGGTAQITLTTPGTYTYHCIYHAWMQATIIVKSG